MENEETLVDSVLPLSNLEHFHRSFILCDVLDKRRQSHQEDEIINVYPFVANCTLDIICGKRNFLEMAIIIFKNMTEMLF